MFLCNISDTQNKENGAIGASLTVAEVYSRYDGIERGHKNEGSVTWN